MNLCFSLFRNMYQPVVGITENKDKKITKACLVAHGYEKDFNNLQTNTPICSQEVTCDVNSICYELVSRDNKFHIGNFEGGYAGGGGIH